MAKLLKDIGGFIGTSTDPDKLRWKHSSNGAFSANRVYTRDIKGRIRSNPYLRRKVWKSIATTNVKCSTCLMARKSCLIQEVL